MNTTGMPLNPSERKQIENLPELERFFVEEYLTNLKGLIRWLPLDMKLRGFYGKCDFKQLR